MFDAPDSTAATRPVYESPAPELAGATVTLISLPTVKPCTRIENSTTI
ncbi:MAG: hypothetical protein R3F36_08305 [Candidatus Competibacteraceae bacterium]